MRHGSLFSGIGGFDLAAEWMGWDNIFHCEWSEFPRKILHHYWPEAISYADITNTDFNVHEGAIDVLTGGFPCQPYSAAGKRKGKDDNRHLWPHMLRAIREIRPTYVVGENVFGLTTWNGGVVLEEVCAELEAEGYAVQPFIIPACAVGAPHRRDRVWIVAYSDMFGHKGDADEAHHRRDSNNVDEYFCLSTQQRQDEVRRITQRYSKERIASYSNLHGRNECNGNDEVNASQGRQYAQRNTQQSNEHGNIANASSEGFERLHGREEANRFSTGLYQTPDWSSFPTVAPICGGNDGIPRELDGITVPKWRRESIKGYGNAIVPQVALQIFKTIQQMED